MRGRNVLLFIRYAMRINDLNNNTFLKLCLTLLYPAFMTAVWVHIDILEKHPAFTYSAESLVATETKCWSEDYNFSNSPCSKLLTHLSLITQVRSTYVQITFLLIRTDTEFYFGHYKFFFSFNNKKLKSRQFLVVR